MNVFAAEEIGARVRRAREEAGLTQEELADLINVGTRMVQHYEAGTHKPFRHLKGIAEATGKDFDWFLRDEDATDDRLGTVLEELAAVRVQVAELLALVQQLQESPASRQATT